MNPNTPGSQTSEHTIVLICQLIAAVLIAVGALDPNKANDFTSALALIGGAIVSATSGASYVLGRSWLKVKTTQVNALYGTPTTPIPVTGPTTDAAPVAGEQSVPAGASDTGSQRQTAA